MTLDETLLRKLANWRPDSARQTAAVEADGWRADVTADAVDTVGAKLWEVALQRTAPEANPAPLAEQAARIAARVTGLMEPLRLVELDPAHDVAQLRSAAPAAKGESLYYYEVERRTDGRSKLRRFQAGNAAAKREQVPFALTHEALAKLVSDLASA
jgi:hypothetical protein